MPPLNLALAAVVPTLPPRDGDADYTIAERILGPILTNITGVCEGEEAALERIVQATDETGCGWVRHANGKMGWFDLSTMPDADGEFELRFSKLIWQSAEGCDSPVTGHFDWWARQYGKTDPPNQFMSQIGRFDIYGPSAAEWDEDSPDDERNEWTGDYFTHEGVFAYDVNDGWTIGLDPNMRIIDLWPEWVAKTFCTYDVSRYGDGCPGIDEPDLLDAYFEKWMIFNEPFTRGLFPWNIIELFRLAKAKTIELQGSGPRSPVYIGGVNGVKHPPRVDGGIERRDNPMTPLERHWALMCYGGGQAGEEYQNDAIAAHFQVVLGPETRFLSDPGEFSRDDYSGAFDASASLFSLGRFWGIDPVRVMLDETTIKAVDGPFHPVSNPPEAQANYLERTLLLALSTGYVDGLHMAWEDHCEYDDEDIIASDTPGCARHRAAGIKKPGFFGAALIHRMLGDANNPNALSYESSLPIEHPTDP
ncbi:MAG: hypothetical protein CME06_05730, partial [Gemmatimonadetes bacterium]|nr:hypothetical protein [Gemmatimonadota bacterium]